jgi:hypothetical protein
MQNVRSLFEEKGFYGDIAGLLGDYALSFGHKKCGDYPAGFEVSNKGQG